MKHNRQRRNEPFNHVFTVVGIGIFMSWILKSIVLKGFPISHMNRPPVFYLFKLFVIGLCGVDRRNKS